MSNNGSNRRRLSALENALGMGAKPTVVWHQTAPGMYTDGKVNISRRQVQQRRASEFQIIVSGLEFDGDERTR